MNSQSAPIGIGGTTPQLGWRSGGTDQTGYQIVVATTLAKLAALQFDKWDTGQVTSASSAAIPYAGTALTSRQRLVWAVRTWSSNGAVSAFSAPATFEMGLLDRTDWTGKWITSPTWTKTPTTNMTAPPLPIFSGQLVVRGALASARMYIAGVGGFTATINGKPGSAAVLEPGYGTAALQSPATNASTKQRVIYSTYDITKLLAQGGNTIGVQLSTGLYDEYTSPGRYYKLRNITGPIAFIAQIEVTYTNGTRQWVPTDTSWMTRSGGTLLADWYGGEDYDARRVLAGWNLPNPNITGWARAVPAAIPASTQLTPRVAVPVQVVATIKAVKATQVSSSVWVIDLGTQMAGWPQLRVRGAAGTKVKMLPSEKLGAHGFVDQSSMGTQGGTYDTYILSGKGVETWHPQFVYHGFRYIELIGLPRAPDLSTITGLVLRTAVAQVGSFTSSNGTLDELHVITDRAMQSNMFSTLTDCPDREKLGWMEEQHLVFDALSGNYDMAAYGRQIEQTILDSQSPTGRVPEFAPEYHPYGGAFIGDPNWSGVIIFLPWKLYQTYGDTDTIAAHYPAMQSYMGYLAATANGNLLTTGLGDWVLPHVANSAPVTLVNSITYDRLATTMASMAGLLGHTDDQAAYTALATRIAGAVNHRYQLPNGSYGTDQASNALALDAGIVPAANRHATAAALIASLAANGGHFSFGEISLPAVLNALSSLGRDDLIAKAVLATDQRYGYAYIVKTGATALTEAWNGTDSQASQNHFMLGAIDQWMIAHVVGIRQTPGTVGFHNLVIAPAMIPGMVYAAASRITPQGAIRASWSVKNGIATVTVMLPANTTATVQLPSGVTQLGPGMHVITSRATLYPHLAAGHPTAATASGDVVPPVAGAQAPGGGTNPLPAG